MSHRNDIMSEFDKFIGAYEFDSMLEAGCRDNFEFREKVEKAGKYWTGFDIEPLSPDDTFVFKDDMNDMKRIASKQYDVVFACHSFEHTLNPLLTLNNFKRVAKKYIFLITPYPCKRQIDDGDLDHLFVLYENQIKKLFTYIGIKTVECYTKKCRIGKGEPGQFDQIVTIGAVE